MAYGALQYEVVDYLLKPLNINDFRKAILKFDRAIRSDFPYMEVKNPVATFEVLDASEAELIEKAPTDEDVNDIEINVTSISLEKATLTQSQEQPLIICVKSYGDYRYIDSRDVLYFEADNNSTDIHLNNGEMITAFKTLKHFETVLPTSQFLRIHNSYIINISQVSRIHTGNTVCYIKNSTTKLPFSKSYKENVDLIISRTAAGNYLEI